MQEREGAGGRTLVLVTIVWATLWCADLLEAWRHAPFDRGGGWVFLVWIVAVFSPRAPRVGGTGRALLAGAWVASLVGAAGELNVAQHGALALAGAAWTGSPGRRFALLMLACGWMPALGWLFRDAGAASVLILRLACGAVCLWLAWSGLRERVAREPLNGVNHA